MLGNWFQQLLWAIYWQICLHVGKLISTMLSCSLVASVSGNYWHEHHYWCEIVFSLLNFQANYWSPKVWCTKKLFLSIKQLFWREKKNKANYMLRVILPGLDYFSWCHSMCPLLSHYAVTWVRCAPLWTLDWSPRPCTIFPQSMPYRTTPASRISSALWSQPTRWPRMSTWTARSS